MADLIVIVWNRIGEMTSADDTKRFMHLFPIAKEINLITFSFKCGEGRSFSYG